MILIVDESTSIHVLAETLGAGGFTLRHRTGHTYDLIQTSKPKPRYRKRAGNITRYLKVCDWARERYTFDGVLQLSSPFSRIEKAAWIAYMGG